MNRFLFALPGNILGCFKGGNVFFHLVAITVTLIFVISGFDWHYFQFTRSPELRKWMFPAVVIGQAVPLFCRYF